jgi:hypothetical protein
MVGIGVGIGVDIVGEAALLAGFLEQARGHAAAQVSAKMRRAK